MIIITRLTLNFILSVGLITKIIRMFASVLLGHNNELIKFLPGYNTFRLDIL